MPEIYDRMEELGMGYVPSPILRGADFPSAGDKAECKLEGEAGQGGQKKKPSIRGPSSLGAQWDQPLRFSPRSILKAVSCCWQFSISLTWKPGILTQGSFHSFPPLAIPQICILFSS